MPEPTFRPYLTASELLFIIDELKEPADGIFTAQRINLVKKLELYQFKISSAHLSPAYQPAKTMAEKLELDDSPAPRSLSEIRLDAYRKYVSDPSSCSALEISRAQEYRYENDLMTTEEETEYAAKM
jgi:hypothetical protein